MTTTTNPDPGLVVDYWTLDALFATAVRIAARTNTEQTALLKIAALLDADNEMFGGGAYTDKAVGSWLGPRRFHVRSGFRALDRQHRTDIDDDPFRACDELDRQYRTDDPNDAA